MSGPTPAPHGAGTTGADAATPTAICRPPAARIIVWDAAVRVCHAGLAVSVTASLWLGYQCDPESPGFIYHMVAGFIALWFLAVRLVLACCGTRTARWRALLHGPRALARYLVDVLYWRTTPHTGLNPATMVFAGLLHLALIALVTTGFDAGWAADWHGWLADVVMVLIACHVSGLILHTVRRRDTSALSMLHGLDHGNPRDGLLRHGWLGGVILALLSALLITVLLRGLSVELAEIRLPFGWVITLPFIQQG